MPTNSIENALRSLTRNEITVLYWKCRGLKHQDIAEMVDYSKEWVQLNMSNVYFKLGIPKDMHSSKRIEILVKDYCPILSKLVRNYGDLNNWPPDEGEPQKNPNTWLMVIEDDLMVIGEEVEPNGGEKPDVVDGVFVDVGTKPQGIQVISESNERSRFRTCLTYGCIGLFLLVGCIAIAYIGYEFTPVKSIIQTAIKELDVTAVVIESSPDVVIPAVTEPPTPIPPSSTVEIVVAPKITDTPNPPSPVILTFTPEYYSEGQLVEIKSGVYLSMSSRFVNSNYSLCEVYPQPGYNIGIDVVNEQQDEFLLRFNWMDFEVTDNTGKSYEIVNTWIDECVSPPGIRSESLRMGETTAIIIQIRGEFPMEARFLIVKAFNISGSGLIVFRKDI